VNSVLDKSQNLVKLEIYKDWKLNKSGKGNNKK
jgi:hypothetical protein